MKPCIQKKTVKKCAILLILFGLVSIVLTLGLVWNRHTDRNHYEQAKKEAISFLEQNEANLKQLFDDFLADKQSDSGEYQKKFYIHMETDAIEYVKLDINAKGMLGGQYWGMIYCPDDNFIHDNASIEIDDERQSGTGNNIFIKEVIKDNWYFYYDDYDGSLDISRLYND